MNKFYVSGKKCGYPYFLLLTQYINIEDFLLDRINSFNDMEMGKSILS